MTDGVFRFLTTLSLPGTFSRYFFLISELFYGAYLVHPLFPFLLKEFLR